MDENKNIKQTLIINNREELHLDGVSNVEGFDEGYVSLSTASGKVVVEGRELKIESLTKEDGAILIKGKIDGVMYSHDKVRTGFFSKFLK